MRLVDSHCHLQAEQFAADIDEVIAAAGGAGVERILVPGWDVASSAAAIALIDRFPGLAGVAVGIHPHAAEETDPGGWARVDGPGRATRASSRSARRGSISTGCGRP